MNTVFIKKSNWNEITRFTDKIAGVRTYAGMQGTVRVSGQVTEAAQPLRRRVGMDSVPGELACSRALRSLLREVQKSRHLAWWWT